MARWRSGNAAVCKTVIRGFEPLPRLHHLDAIAMLVLSGLTDPAVACTSVLGAWQLLQSHSCAAYEQSMRERVTDGVEVNIP
jgi:hypothetical protein